MSKSVLVTGGAGYIGAVLVPHLLNLGHKVIVVDNFMYKQSSLAHVVGHQNLKLVYADVRDEHEMKKILSQCDTIIPLAAIVGAPACLKDPINASSINKHAMTWLFDNVSGNQQIIMPTTNSAYGSGELDNYCDEKSPLNPLSTYAKDKVYVEEKLMTRENSTSFRLATVFGISPRMRIDLLVNNFVYRAMKDNFIVLFEGHFKRNYVHLHDVCRAFAYAIDNPKLVNGEIFNYGLSNANLSKIELCEAIQAHIPGFTFFESSQGKDPDQRNYIVSNEKIEKIGIKATVTLSYGISELIKGLKMFDTNPYTNL